ncbi:MAG: hypothetical protein A2Y33_15075 [Spirochaetes bacterium GWF1_51_8]|nr:MAG: hypothetical protein A2Y33_15075 [Spirochaetes bacterium GWF1_51_8]
MKKLAVAMTALLFLSCQDVFVKPVHTQIKGDSSYVFDLSALPVITIEVSSEQWNNLLKIIDANWDSEEMVEADFKFEKNGVVETLYGIGIRIRGNTSRKRPEGSYGEPHNPSAPKWNHAHFKLDFGEFAKGKNEFHSLGGLNLKYFRDDGNYVREIFCYDLFRKFGVWTAPQVGFCRLYIHVAGDAKPAYYGVYKMIEPYDEYYLKARFDSQYSGDDGYLWKCLWGANLSKPGAKDVGIESINPTNNSLSIAPCYDLKTKKGQLGKAQAMLLKFIQNLNKKKGDDFKNWISQAMDVDLLLRLYAVNNLVGMWDDYWKNNGNNYYLYFDEWGKCYFLPYDYDNTLGISIKSFGNTATIDILNWGPKPKPVLLNKVLEIPEFKEKYIRYIAELISPTNDLFDFTASTNRILGWQKMISPYIVNDTGKEMAIIDLPTAGWGSFGYYKLLTGDATGKFPNANYIKTRIVFAQLQLGLPTNGNTWMYAGPTENGDKIPPVFLPAEKKQVTNLGPFVGIINVKLDESCAVFYTVLPDSAPAPTAKEIVDGNGMTVKGEFIVQPNNTGYNNFCGLKENSQYKVYMAAMDVYGNLTPSPSVFNLATPSAPFLNPKDNGTSITIRIAWTNTNAVYLMGDFNQWKKTANPLQKVSDGIWEITLDKKGLKKGDGYIFAVFPFKNGNFLLDENNPSNTAVPWLRSIFWW